MKKRQSDPGKQGSPPPDDKEPDQMQIYRPDFVKRPIKFPKLRNIEAKYRGLVKKDLKLAETLRLADPKILPKEKKINPFHTRVSRKGIIWVDVMLERRLKPKKVTIRELERIMQVYGRPGRGPFITGRVRVERLPELNNEELTVRLQTGQPVAPLGDYYSVRLIEADRNILRDSGLRGIDGSGVIIGFVDMGCDFDHPNFKIRDETTNAVTNKTRLLDLWDQNGQPSNNRQHYPYGAEYTHEDINAALGTPDPYAMLKYRPPWNAHGTHVMDIAAGSSMEQEGVGVAPRADLIFVDLRRPAAQKDLTNEEVAEWQLNTLGSSGDLFDAVQYIFERAREHKKPAVVNISLGTNGGAHNGTSLVESEFDYLLTGPRAKYGRAIVIGAGNEFRTKLHTKGEVTAGGFALLEWHIPKLPDLPGLDLRQELEIWYPKDTALKIELLDLENRPMDGLLCRFGKTCTSDEPDFRPIWTIHNGQAKASIDQRNNHIHILVDNQHPDFREGDWTLRLSHNEIPTDNDHPVKYHAWIERNPYPSQKAFRFVRGSSSENTLNGIGNARWPIVVGACGAHDGDASTPIPLDITCAGRSLNPDAPHKPELYAPGSGIESAATTGDHLPEDGTSMATPHVAGVIALMFQKALSLAPSRTLSIQEIRSILTDTVSKKQAYNPRSGFGRVNCRGALLKISETE